MNLAEKAYEQIRGEIITCVLAPGMQINQGEISEKLQLGITPVREALTRLSHEGLVTSLPRYGYLVCPITIGDLDDLFEYRIILETASVRLAIQKATDDQLKQVAAMADFTYHYKELEDHSEFLRRNADFHCAIASLSGNRRIIEALSLVLDELTRFFHLGLNLRDSAEEMRSEHLALVKELLNRNEVEAEKVGTAQIERSKHRILEALQNAGMVSNALSLVINGQHKSIQYRSHNK
jgi:DNA-binding GntR family transcriptional regulator